jgi:hypothetical protein
MKKLIAATLIAGTALVGFPGAAGADGSLDIGGLLPPGGACGEDRVGVVITVDQSSFEACVHKGIIPPIPTPSYGLCSYPNKGVWISYLGHNVAACIDAGWVDDMLALSTDT